MAKKVSILVGMCLGLLMMNHTSAADLSGKKEAVPKNEAKAGSPKDFIDQMEDQFGADLYKCQKNSDCALVQASLPCSCNSGGKNTAINSKFEKDWNASYKKALQAGPLMMCATVYNCAESARCENKKCVTSKKQNTHNKPFKRPLRPGKKQPTH